MPELLAQHLRAAPPRPRPARGRRAGTARRRSGSAGSPPARRSRAPGAPRGCVPSRSPTVSQTFAPCWRSIVTLIGGTARPSTVMPRRSGSSVAVGRRALGPHPVLAHPAGRGQLQPPLQRAVVGQQQQPLGIEVEPPDADHPRHLRRQMREHRVAALLVALDGDEPDRLVVAPQPRRLGRRQRLAVDGDRVGGA